MIGATVRAVSQRPDADLVREATRLLAEASEHQEDNFLMMTTTDLRDLLSASELGEDVVAGITRRAFQEFNAPKLAHLDAAWRGAHEEG